MALTVSKVEKTRPRASKPGRVEDPKWDELVDTIKAQTPGEWITYAQLDGTEEAVRYAQRLRSKAAYSNPQGAFARLGRENVRVALVRETVNEEGKRVGTLSICYMPQNVDKTPEKPATKKPAAKKAPAKRPTTSKK